MAIGIALSRHTRVYLRLLGSVRDRFTVVASIFVDYYCRYDLNLITNILSVFHSKHDTQICFSLSLPENGR